MDFKKMAFNNITRNFRAYLGYFLCCSFSIMIFFTFAVSMFHPIIANAGMATGSAAYTALMTTEAIIFGFSIFFIIYSLSNFIKSRSREFGTLIIMGMSEKQFKKLVLLENLIIGILSIMSAIVGGLLTSKLFLSLLSKIFSMNLNSFYFPIKAILLTVMVFMILFMITGPITLRFINKKRMLDLLKGEQKPKKEIKQLKIMGILGILLILTSYALILFSNRIGIQGGMYIMAILVIVGIYLFYSQFVVLFLNNIKKKELIYKNNTNMLLISNLVYKMRDNAKLLFIITVLLSGTLIALSVTNTLVATQGESSKVVVPITYSYLSKEENPNEKEELKIIKNTIKDYNYREINLKILCKDTKDLVSEDAFVKIDDYNKLAKYLNLDTINLKDNEAYLLPKYSRKEFINQLKSVKEYDMSGKKLDVVGVANKNVFPEGLFNGTVVISNNLYSSLEDKYKKISFYGFDYDDWKNTVEETIALKKHFMYNSNKEKTSYLMTLPDLYSGELQQSRVLKFMGTSIAIVFFIGVLSFLYFRLFTDEALDRVKYENLSKIGLSYKNMRRIVGIEVGSLFLIPLILSSINTIVVLVFISNSLRTGMGFSPFKILGLLFIIYIVYFIIIRNRYIKNIWSEKKLL